MTTTVLIVLLWLGSVFCTQTPDLPQRYQPTRPDTFANTLYANNTQELVDALQLVNPGDRIILKAGVNFVVGGTLALPVKNNPDKKWILVTTSEENSLPMRGTRVSPTNSELMPKIKSDNFEGPITAESGVSYWWFSGIEVTFTDDALGDINTTPIDNSGAIRLLRGSSDFVFDRCYLHGTPVSNSRRGFILNAARVEISDCYLSDWQSNGQDAQAIAGWDGPGPFRIFNNYIAGAGENIMIGGADPTDAEGVASDIEIVHNHIHKPARWNQNDPAYNGYDWVVKNLFEIKHGKRWLIEGNIFENNWADAQTGTAINIKLSDGNTLPFLETSHITFQHNIIRNTGSGISISKGGDPTPNTMLFYNNLFDVINTELYPGDGDWMRAFGAINVTLDHNTGVSFTRAWLLPNEGSDWTITNNLGKWNTYALKGDGKGDGLDSLSVLDPYIWESNGFFDIEACPVTYPEGTICTIDPGFVGNGNYSLSPTSAFYAQGNDGKDIGVIWDLLMEKVDGVIEGTTHTLSAPLSSTGPSTSTPFSASPGAPSTTNTPSLSSGQTMLPNLVVLCAIGIATGDSGGNNAFLA